MLPFFFVQKNVTIFLVIFFFIDFFLAILEYGTQVFRVIHNCKARNKFLFSDKRSKMEETIDSFSVIDIIYFMIMVIGKKKRELL
jgi:hypothetical protein